MNPTDNDLIDDPTEPVPVPGPDTSGPHTSGTDDDDWVPLPADTNGGRRVLGLVAAAVLLVAFVIGGVVFWAARRIDPPGPPGAAIASLVVPPGSSTSGISTLLEKKGVVTDAKLFSAYVGMKGAGPFKAGRYTEFRKDSSFDEAITVLDKGPVPVGATTVRVSEGKRLADALQQIAQQHPGTSVDDLTTALNSGQVRSKYLPAGSTNWEGLLFPDTYLFRDDATAAQILQTLATQMEKVLDGLGYDRAEVLQGRSAYELITAASIAERETGQPPEERGKIIRTMYNRLDAKQPLGVDASVLYGLGRAGGALTETDLKTDTPYNTRLRPGLPPTPISLPSKASLQAAIAPPDGPWLYYVLVSNTPPSHLFTASYQEFLKAKADAKARGVF